MTITVNDIVAAGAFGFYISDSGAINYPEICNNNSKTFITSADCTNGSVHAATNAGGTASGDEVKIVTIPAEGYCVHDVYTTVNGVNTDIEKSEMAFKSKCIPVDPYSRNRWRE